MDFAKLSFELHSKICMVLGRQVLESESSEVASFENFSENDIKEFRMLGRISAVLAISFIRFRLAPKFDLNTVTSYYATVVQQRFSLNEWRAMD